MPVDPYQNCPCGSGKKLKWCCQKVAKFAEKAEQLLEKDQVAAALLALDEGLAVEPSNLWLRTLKAQILLSTHDHDAAYPLVEETLASNPGYRPMLQLRLQDELAHGDAAAAVASLQSIIESTPAEEMEESLAWMCLLGRALAELGYGFASLQHLRYAASRESFRAEIERDLAALEGSPDLAPWLRDSYELRPAPANAGTFASKWDEALKLAGTARWLTASTIFDSITSEQPESADAWFNLGICRGWSAHSESAAASLERSAQLESDSERAVHAMALAQCLDPRESAQSVDVIRIRYAIRDHSRLIQKLKEHPRLQVHKLDSEQEDKTDDVKDEFYLLNKDFVMDVDSATLDNLPAIVGVVRTRGPNLELEFADPAADDPRPGLMLEAVGDTVDPAGERTVAGTIPVSTYRLRRMWGVPSGARPEAVNRIRRMVHDQLYREIWADSPMGWLGNKTPQEAAQVPELKVRLRAAVLLVEYASEAAQFNIDLDDLRRRVGLDREATFEGDAVDLDRLPLARLRQVRAETLSTPRVRSLFERALRFTLSLALQQSASTLVSRPSDREQFDATAAFRALIEFARIRQDRAGASDLIQRARQFDAAAGVQPERPTWEIADWQVSFQFDRPEEWAPRLALLLQKFAQDRESSSELMLVLVRVGLTRVVQHPNDPNRAMMDTRVLEQVLARYGTRQSSVLDLTPVGGQPGKIWTPGSDSGAGGSPIVLPGQEPPSQTRSKLVIPGR